MKFVLKFKDGETFISSNIEEINKIPCVEKTLGTHVSEQGFLNFFLGDEEQDSITLTVNGEEIEYDCSELHSIEIIFD